jgi:class 3 adenylate cyclase
VTPPGVYSHIGLDWRSDARRSIFERLAARRTLVRYDRRGTGCSQRDVGPFSLESAANDLAAVVAAVGNNQPVDLFAMGTHGPPAISYAVSNPAAVAHLILYDSYVSRSVLKSSAWGETMMAVASALATRDLGQVGRMMAPLMNTAAEWEAAYIQAAITPEHLLESMNAEFGVAELLDRVRCPTLVIDEEWAGGTGHRSDLASRIPDAGFHAIPRSDRDGWEAFADVTDLVYPFLGEHSEYTNSRAASLRTVLFTDLVGHTEMMRRLGDERGRDVLREHERITRDLLKQFGGAEVKTMGDGFMASFASVTKAVDCAIALQRAFSAWNEQDRAQQAVPLHVRVGLNAGEPIEEDGDLFGSTVIMASRIAALASAGEILIPEPLRHLLSGKSYVYADRGEVMLKGFEDPVRLYQVRWQS